MDQTVVLVPLKCIKCSTPIPAEPDEVVWVCSICGQAMYLDEENGLQAQEIYFTSGLSPAAPGKPYWVTDGKASVQRETFGSSKDKDSLQFWSQARRFFIPAYAASLEELLSRATQLLQNPPALQAGAAGSFLPVVMNVQDVSAAADFLVVAIEAGRSDRLKKIDFQLNLSAPVLWILPE